MIENNVEVISKIKKVWFIDSTPYKISQKFDKNLTLLT